MTVILEIYGRNQVFPKPEILLTTKIPVFCLLLRQDAPNFRHNSTGYDQKLATPLTHKAVMIPKSVHN